MKLIKLVAAIGLMAQLTACASMFEYRPYARSVKKMPKKGGVIALNLQHRAEDQGLAQNMMKETCGNKTVDILEEGEVVIGSVTNSSATNEAANKHKVGSFLGANIMSGHDGQVNTTSETTQKKEWQIKYRCS